MALLLLLGFVFLLVGKWVIFFIVGVKSSAPPDMNKVGEDNYMDDYLKNKQKVFGFGLNIHKIFEILWGIWWIVCILYVINM